MTVIYEIEDKPQRYRVEFFASGIWITSSQSYRTRLFAKWYAIDLAARGKPARVIDTKGEES